VRQALLEDARKLGSRSHCVLATFDILDRLEANGIVGDFVECGVWHGAQPIMAKKYCQAKRYTPRKYWCFDTFEGMPPGGPDDINYTGGRPLHKPKDWLSIPLSQVQNNFAQRGLLDDSVVFVKGKVEETLTREPIPERISYLRLDTDFYSSTFAELQFLYPKLVRGGALVIDDYGWWLGAKKAVDSYFGREPEMVTIDKSARLIWKTDGVR
jgi:O-methyltransferase